MKRKREPDTSSNDELRKIQRVSMKSNLTVPLAYIHRDGKRRLIQPQQVESKDQAGPFTCVGCQQSIVFRNASRRVHRMAHFAHKSSEDAESSGCNGESLGHKMAKLLFIERRHLWSFLQKCRGNGGRHSYHCSKLRTWDPKWDVSDAEPEVTFSVPDKKYPYRLDVGLFDARGQLTGAVEVQHTHASSLDKLHDLQSSGLVVVEIKADDILKVLENDNHSELALLFPTAWSCNACEKMYHRTCLQCKEQNEMKNMVRCREINRYVCRTCRVPCCYCKRPQTAPDWKDGCDDCHDLKTATDKLENSSIAGIDMKALSFQLKLVSDVHPGNLLVKNCNWAMWRAWRDCYSPFSALPPFTDKGVIQAVIKVILPALQDLMLNWWKRHTKDEWILHFKDYPISREIYTLLGFQVENESGDMIRVRIKGAPAPVKPAVAPSSTSLQRAPSLIDDDDKSITINQTRTTTSMPVLLKSNPAAGRFKDDKRQKTRNKNPRSKSDLIKTLWLQKGQATLDTWLGVKPTRAT